MWLDRLHSCVFVIDCPIPIHTENVKWKQTFLSIHLGGFWLVGMTGSFHTILYELKYYLKYIVWQCSRAQLNMWCIFKHFNMSQEHTSRSEYYQYRQTGWVVITKIPPCWSGKTHHHHASIDTSNRGSLRILFMAAKFSLKRLWQVVRWNVCLV